MSDWLLNTPFIFAVLPLLCLMNISFCFNKIMLRSLPELGRGLENRGNCLKFYLTAQNLKFPIKDFFSKCDQIRIKLRIWSHLLRKSLMGNFSFCAVWAGIIFGSSHDCKPTQTRYKLAQKLISSFAEQRCTVVISTTPISFHVMHFVGLGYGFILIAIYLFFYKQPVCKKLAFRWQISKQRSGLNALSLSNNKN